MTKEDAISKITATLFRRDYSSEVVTNQIASLFYQLNNNLLTIDELITIANKI